MLKSSPSYNAYKNLILITPAIVLLTLGAGCGSQNLAGLKTQTGYAGGGGGGVATGTTTTTTDGSSTPTNTGVAPYTFPINGTGYSSISISVSTSQILKVKFAPGRQNRTIQNTGYTPQYSALGVFIKVGGDTQATALLNNGYYAAAESSTALDFSASFTKNCAASNTTCRQQVTITVLQPNDDDACINLGYTYCPYAHVPDGHPWNGTLTVQTDDTNSI
jgi:hypothetical protein